MNTKKVIFFDGDGTLWYPKRTKRTRKPHWIYNDIATKDEYLTHLELTPGTKDLLKALNAANLYLVVISASPYAEDVATREIKERLDYFGIAEYFYSYRPSDGGDSKDKARVMLETIEALNLKKEEALMIGDSYYYDYLAARDVGIDALFIKNDVSKMPEAIPVDLHTIDEARDLLSALRDQL